MEGNFLAQIQILDKYIIISIIYNFWRLLFAHTKIFTIFFVRFLSLSIFKDLFLSLQRGLVNINPPSLVNVNLLSYDIQHPKFPLYSRIKFPPHLFLLPFISFLLSPPRPTRTPPAGEEPGLATYELRPPSLFLRPAPRVVASVRCVAKVSSLAFLTFISRCGTTFYRSISRSTYDLLDERFPYSFISSSALRERERQREDCVG